MSAPITPGTAAICPGTVVHHRRSPADHRFSYPVSLIWLDPDEPDELFANHPLWSADRFAPVRFRRRDYLHGNDEPLGLSIRDLATEALDHRPAGPIRMLTQPRRWGWLFNPITVYLVWDDGGHHPAAAVLEVTNTPWKERTTYAVALAARHHRSRAGVGATFPKTLHVSPFLDEDYCYELLVTQPAAPEGLLRLAIDLDVVPHRIQSPDRDGVDVETSKTSPVLTTRLLVDRRPPNLRTMNTALLTNPLATHRVSLGIHRQAVALWRKGIPFVAHPRRRSPSTSPARVHGERRR